MSIEECYKQLGGDYTQVLARLMSPRLVIRFIAKFPDDKSFEQLAHAMAQQNRADAFRAAHTLKGVCQNLGLDRLLVSVQTLTELLRPQSEQLPAQAVACFEDVQQDYAQTVCVIREFLASCPQDRA